MNGTGAIESALKSSKHLVNWFLSDLSDADLLVRPVPGANHIAWQLGHLIDVECRLMASHLPGTAFPELPEGFREKHTRDNAGSDRAEEFLKKEEYLALFNKVRETSL